MVRLSGIFPALTTPFDGDGEVLPEHLAENIGRYEHHGLAGYLVLGSTGEAAALDEREKVALLRAAREAVPREKTLVAGVGLESTAGTIRLAHLAADAGADAALVITPHFFRSAMTAAALEAHYRAVADASPIPVLLYSVPKFTGVAIEAPTTIALAAHPNIAGLKESAEGVRSIVDVLRGVTDAFSVLGGHAGSCRSALSAGASGAILAAAAAIPEPFVAIARLVADGDVAAAASLQRRVAGAARLLASSHGLAGLKAALDVRGLHGGPPRRPLLPIDAAARQTIERCLGRLASECVLHDLAL